MSAAGGCPGGRPGGGPGGGRLNRGGKVLADSPRGGGGTDSSRDMEVRPGHGGRNAIFTNDEGRSVPVGLLTQTRVVSVTSREREVTGGRVGGAGHGQI